MNEEYKLVGEPESTVVPIERPPVNPNFDELGILVVLEGLEQAKHDLITAIRGEIDGLVELAARYRIAAERIIEALEGPDFAPGQIHLILHMGLLRYEAGDINGCLVELNDAHTYAWNQGLDELADAIDRVISKLS